MGLDRKKEGKLSLRDVSRSPYTEEFDYVRGTLHLVNNNGTTEYPEAPNKIVTFTVKYEPIPEN